MKPTGSAPNKIFHSDCTVTKKSGGRNWRTLVLPMKLKDKIQQVLVAHNCWRTDTIPKLPQRESQGQL